EGTPLGTYAGDLRFFNDQYVPMLINTQPNAPFPGFQYVENKATNNDGLLDRLGAQGAAEEPFTDPTFTLKLRVTENLALGSVNDPGNRPATATGPISRMTPAAGLNLLDRANFPDRNPLLLFFSQGSAAQ